MPDVSTIRDMARKVERWRDTLGEDERDALTGWMALGVGREELAGGRRWWFDPDTDHLHPRAAGPER